jgi:hypothetical protein
VAGYHYRKLYLLMVTPLSPALGTYPNCSLKVQAAAAVAAAAAAAAQPTEESRSVYVGTSAWEANMWR